MFTDRVFITDSILTVQAGKCRSTANAAQSPPHTVRKELSKMPREVVSSTVSSRVRQSFGEKFASRGREENI